MASRSTKARASASANSPAGLKATPAQQRRDWSARSEQASLRLSPTLLAQAQANSQALGDDTSLLAVLANELAQTRGPELTRAYRSVVMVSAGFKKTQHQGTHRLTLAPCVVFIVRRKWTAEQTDASHAQHLPRWLVVYPSTTVSAARLRCPPTCKKKPPSSTRWRKAMAPPGRIHPAGRGR
ncbi:hypothetical protein ACVBEH_14210 [Roseateles sp. GG27B]